MAMPLINEALLKAEMTKGQMHCACASLTYWHGVVRLNFLEFAENFAEAREISFAHTDLAHYIIVKAIKLGEQIHIKQAEFA